MNVNRTRPRKLRRRPRGAGLSDFGHLVRLRLIVLGRTQRWLAHELGQSYQAISSKLRTEYPQDRTVREFCRALKCKPSDLVRVRTPEADFDPEGGC